LDRIAMPYLRFLSFTGAALLATMFIADACLPKPGRAGGSSADIDRSTIRISSSRKGPERVVIDTSLPTVVPASPIQVSIAAPPAATTARDAYAQIPAEQATRLDPPEARSTGKEAKSMRRAERRHLAVRPSAEPQQAAPVQQPRRVAGDMFAPWLFR